MRGCKLPRKTDSKNPADWVLIAEGDLAMLRAAIGQEAGFPACRSKLAESLERLLRAELIRLGWKLEKTHDLNRLVDELNRLNSDLIRVVTPVAKDLAEVYFMDRYPGFDLDDPDWPALRKQLAEVETLLTVVKARSASE